jgi:hypothetical protein
VKVTRGRGVARTSGVSFIKEHIMISEKKRAANQENARRSTGPRTDEGRRRSAMNAVRHGFCAKTVCVHGEEAEHFNALVAEFVREHRPASSTEYALVYRMAVASWNLRRVTEAETAMIDAATFHRAFESGKWVEKRLPVGEAVLKVIKDDKRFGTLQLYQQRLERAFYRALTELRHVRKEAAERAESDPEEEETVETIPFATMEAPAQSPCSRELARDGDASVGSPREEKRVEQTNPTPDPKPAATPGASPARSDGQAPIDVPVRTNKPISSVDPRYPLSIEEKRIFNETRRLRGLPPLPMDKRILVDGTILPD